MTATVGNDVIFATSATLGGHCEIGDFVYIGGLSAVHQMTRIGPQVMVGGVCGVRGDVIPFGLVNGQYAALEGLNIIGLKRRKFTKQRLATVRISIKNSSTVPASLPSGSRPCSPWPRKIRRSPRYSPSSPRPSTARSACRPPARSTERGSRRP